MLEQLYTEAINQLRTRVNEDPCGFLAYIMRKQELITLDPVRRAKVYAIIKESTRAVVADLTEQEVMDYFREIQAADRTRYFDPRYHLFDVIREYLYSVRTTLDFTAAAVSNTPEVPPTLLTA